MQYILPAVIGVFLALLTVTCIGAYDDYKEAERIEKECLKTTMFAIEMGAMPVYECDTQTK